MAFFEKGESSMLIFYYVLLWQITETLSIMIPAIIFLIIHYIFHMNVKDIKEIIKKHTKLKIAAILFILEALAFIPMFPILQKVFSIYSSNAKILAYSIFILQLLPWFLKFQKAKEMLEEEHDDHAIYQ